MTIQYVIAAVLLLGGSFTAWAGPVYGVGDDGRRFSAAERRRVRLYGIGLAVCGLVVLMATLLGFRGEPLREMPAP